MIRNKILFLPLIAMFVSTIGGLSGCTSPASQKGMVVSNILDVHRHSRTVAVISQGGSVGSGDRIIISNDNFAEALKESIIKSGLFTKVIYGEDSDYILRVAIVRTSIPSLGPPRSTVSIFAEWSLFDIGNREVMKETIKSSYTTTMGDSLLAHTRFRHAVEGAVRENIRLGLIAISKLQL